MKKVLLFLLVAGLGIGVFLFVRTPSPPQEDPNLEHTQEHVGQVLMIGFEGKSVTPELRSLMETVRPGGILLLGRNIESKEQVRKLVRDLQQISLENTGSKLFVAVDQEGGVISRIPFAEDTRQSDLQDYDHAFLVGKERAEDLADIGVNMNLAPVLDSRNPGDFVYPRSFQKNFTESLEIAKGLIVGHQEGNVIAVPKHFPGYDTISFNPEESEIPRVARTPDTLLFPSIFYQVPLPFVMISHVIYKDMDPHAVFPFSSKGIQFAKKELGSNILIMSDDILSPAFLKHFSYRDIGRNAVKAGVHMMIAAGYPDPGVVLEFYTEFMQEIEQDKELKDMTQESSKRIMEVKKEMLQ